MAPRPDCPFLLLGAGPRRKLLYRKGQLRDVRTGETVWSWSVAAEHFHHSEYRVVIETQDGKVVTLREDEEGVWLEEEGGQACLAEGHVSLPALRRSPPRETATHPPPRAAGEHRGRRAGPEPARLPQALVP